ncbi:MAG TPA: ABC transporter permease [Anaerolineae bacterium]|nr:ABC transporter permease [Anaerolineae bacterium]
MNKYVLKKIGWALLTVVFVVVLNFFLFRILPGDPAKAVRDPRLTQEAVEAIRVRYGLDKPVINCVELISPLRLGSCLVNPLDTQFFRYIINLLQGELGISFHQQRPVATILAENLWNTLLLIGPGVILSIILGVLLGLIAAWKSRTVIDYSALFGALMAWACPTFWFGMILLFWGSSQFGLPIGGKSTPGGDFSNIWEEWLDIGRHMILPTLTYTIIYAGQYTLFMRSAVLEIFSEDYVLTAKAKGLNTFQILRDHALPNALLPTVTVVALNLGFTVAGAIEVETVYSWPGLGQAVVEAVGRQDYPMLQGAFLLLAISVIFANLAADLLYSYLDPRIQTG